MEERVLPKGIDTTGCDVVIQPGPDFETEVFIMSEEAAKHYNEYLENPPLPLSIGDMFVPDCDVMTFIEDEEALPRHWVTGVINESGELKHVVPTAH